MSESDVTALTSAFNATGLLDTFVSFAPFIIGIVGVVIGVNLIKWGVRAVRRKLSGGVA